jgi:hypothetical protein
MTLVTRHRPSSRLEDKPHRAAVATPTPEGAVKAKQRDVALLPEDLIGGDESVIFAIKPSLWFIVFDSGVWIVGALLLVAASSFVANVLPSISESQFMTAVMMAVGVRVGVSVLRWVSRFYVLTNRRVMRIRGVRQANVFECPLLNIRNTGITTDFPEALTGLGTLNFMIADRDARSSQWRNIADPQEIHAEVRKAIERAIDRQPRL